MPQPAAAAAVVPLVPKRSSYESDEAYEAAREEYVADKAYLAQHQLAFTGARRPAPACYGPGVFQWDGFAMTDKDGQRMEFSAGGFVSDAMASRPGRKGDVGANSIAWVLCVLEDQEGHCWLGLHYFWRWGQIHADADLAGTKEGCPRLLAPCHSAELFLQAELLVGTYYQDAHPHHAVTLPNGRCRELRSAASMDHPVTVLTQVQVQQRHPGLHWMAALDAYQEEYCHMLEADSGVRRDYFYWRYTFDNSCYAFQFDPRAFGEEQEVPRVLLTQAERTMGDIFCGAGHVAQGARTAGFAVAYGVDSDGSACSSFYSNTLDTPLEPPFNPPGFPRAQTKRATVEEFVREAAVSGGRGGPLGVGWLHFSPPCQNLSAAKPIDNRTLTGETLMVVPELVSLLRPAYVTLEEVPGFISQRFRRDKMLVYKVAAARRRQARRSAAAAAAAASESRALHTQQQQDGQEADEEGDSCCLPGAEEQQQQQQGEEEEEGGQGLGAGGVRVHDLEDEDAQEINAGLQELQALGNSSSSSGGQHEVFRSFLLVVPQLLDLGYQVRMCMMDCAQYGVPQSRTRVFLFASRLGYKLPDVPTPRYQPGPHCRKYFVDSSSSSSSSGQKLTDPTFQPKEAEGGVLEAAAWYDVLTACAAAAVPEGPESLLPCVSTAEAIGDLPPIMSSGHGSSSGSGSSSSSRGGSNGGCGGSSSSGDSCSWHLTQLVAGGAPWKQEQQEPPQGGPSSSSNSGDSGVQQQQGRQQGQRQHRPQQGVLRAALSRLRAAGQEAARKAPPGRGMQFGQDAHDYDPQQAVLPYSLAGVPAAAPVADLRPLSAFAQFCRTPRAQEGPPQALRGFHPGVLRGHTYPQGPTLKLPTAGQQVMNPLGTVGTVVGKNYGGRGTVHFAEPRLSTHRERARAQGSPDWMLYEGSSRSRDQQVGNAVPYPVAVEVAASVWTAATGQQGHGLPVLVGPSPAGYGVPAADKPRWDAWWEGLGPEGKQAVVEGWRDVMQEALAKPAGGRPAGKKAGRPAKRSEAASAAAAAAGADEEEDGEEDEQE